MFERLKRSAAARKHRPRPPRDPLSCSATIVANNRFYRATLLNISRAGCRARVRGNLQPDQGVQIALEAFHSLSGTVRWSKGEEVGIQFTRPLSDFILAKWQRELERGDHRQPLVPRRRWLRDFWGELAGR